MKLAYVDTSCLLAVAFAEAGHRPLASRLGRFDRLFASNLLEAELRAALVREGVTSDPTPLLSRITWIHPNRPLTEEINQVLSLGYIRGADLWHLACALFLDPTGTELSFLTLDRRQQQTAARLGFAH
jgi:hypothetical protein